MKLSLKQKKFIDEYIISGNATQSAVKAGYSESYAKTHVYKLLENASVKNEIDKRMKQLENQKIATQQEVLEYLTSVMRGEETETIIIDRMAREVPVSAKERIKASELLGKRYGTFTDKQEIDVNVGVEFIDDID